MDCVNHAGVSVASYCQNCGKGLCAGCIQTGPGGQILCEPCSKVWQGYQQPFSAMPAGGPNPSAAAVLGLIPGVGAMYNGQFFKGLIHVVIFAVLVSLASNVNGIFGIFIAAWVLYQSFEAYHTALALRNGTPLPDPLGLNEVGNWLNLGTRPTVPPAAPPTGAPGQAPPAGPGYDAGAGQPAASTPPPNQSGWQGPYTGPASGAWQNPWTPPSAGIPPIPPIPPVPPSHWRRREPVGAIVLIGLGILFLLGRLDFFSFHVFEYSWPLMLIGLGVWLIVRRVGDQQGGPK